MFVAEPRPQNSLHKFATGHSSRYFHHVKKPKSAPVSTPRSGADLGGLQYVPAIHNNHPQVINAFGCFYAMQFLRGLKCQPMLWDEGCHCRSTGLLKGCNLVKWAALGEFLSNAPCEYSPTVLLHRHYTFSIFCAMAILKILRVLPGAWVQGFDVVVCFSTRTFEAV